MTLEEDIAFIDSRDWRICKECKEGFMTNFKDNSGEFWGCLNPKCELYYLNLMGALEPKYSEIGANDISN